MIYVQLETSITSETNNNLDECNGEIGPNRRRTAIPLFIEGSDELGVESVEILHEIEVSKRKKEIKYSTHYLGFFFSVFLEYLENWNLF